MVLVRLSEEEYAKLQDTADLLASVAASSSRHKGVVGTTHLRRVAAAEGGGAFALVSKALRELGMYDDHRSGGRKWTRVKTKEGRMLLMGGEVADSLMTCLGDD